MNRLLSSKALLVLAVLTFFAASCTKEDNTLNQNNFFSVGDESPVALKLGIIEDMGPVNLPTRHMHTTFIDKGYVLDHKTGEISGTGSLVNIGFYTDEDGLIPTGTYIFSNSPTKLPFTFDSGYITEKFNLETEEGHYHSVTSGTIIVIQDGDIYDITFDCILDTQSKLVGTFKGSMEYFDRHQF